MNEITDQRVAARVRQLQVFVGLMVLAAAAVLILSVTGEGFVLGHREPGRPPVLTYMGVGLGVMALVAVALIPYLVSPSTRARMLRMRTDAAQTESRAEAIHTEPRPGATRPGLPLGTTSDRQPIPDVARLTAVYAYIVALRAGWVGCAALLSAVAFQAEQEMLGAVTAATLVLALAAQIPTHTRMAQWLQTELRHIEQMRSPTI